MKVSLIVPTGNRHLLLRRALAQIARQTYRGEIEVVVVDGGSRPCAWVSEIAFRDASGRRTFEPIYVRAGELTTVGARRNLAVETATGDVIAHWDDDDFYAPPYLEVLLRWFEEEPTDLGGMCQFWHYDFLLKRGWKTNLWETKDQPYGACMIYPKRMWQEVGRFEDLQRGEDDAFVRAFLTRGLAVRALRRPDLFVYLRHTRNVSWASDPILHPQWTASARAVLESEITFYDDLAELVHQPTERELGVQFHLPSDLRTFVPPKRGR